VISITEKKAFIHSTKNKGQKLSNTIDTANTIKETTDLLVAVEGSSETAHP